MRLGELRRSGCDAHQLPVDQFAWRPSGYQVLIAQPGIIAQYESNHSEVRRFVDQRDRPNTRHFQFRIEGRAGRPSGPIAKFLAFTLGVAALAAGLFLSVFVFAGLLVAGVVAGGWFWWRTRGLRKQLKDTLRAAEERLAAARSEADRRATGDSGEQAMAGIRRGESRTQDTVIDGDYIREKSEGPRT